MKNLLIVILSLSISYISFCQENGGSIERGDLIYFKTDTKHKGTPKKYNDIYDRINSRVNKLESEFRYKYIDQVSIDDTIYYEVRALNFGPPKKNTGQPYIDYRFYYNGKIYLIEKEVFEKNARQINKDVFKVGMLYLPIKLRTNSDTKFETNFNLNGVANIKLTDFNNRAWTVNFIAGLGLTKLNITKRDDQNNDIEGLTDIMGVSLVSGISFEYKKIQFGLFVGVDKINNNSEINWEDNNKLWYSLGIGTSLFTILESKTDSQ